MAQRMKKQTLRVGVGGPHTAIREDASMNLAAVAELMQRHEDLDLVFVESGGDKPFVFTNLKTGAGLDEVIRILVEDGMLSPLDLPATLAGLQGLTRAPGSTQFAETIRSA